MLKSKTVVGAMMALVAATGVAMSVPAEADAAFVRDTGARVFIGFTHAETVQLANSGVPGIFNHPAVRPYYYVSADKDSKFERLYIPGKGRVIRADVRMLLREAASHRNGRSWISFNRRSPRLLTIWTRW
ncbi:MAG: hypothetical protein QM728_00680 [Gordonia sp. (in: high G+C Gram-positive bacteria)]|uniref:hypothetical protein n=1 Tax=Gordonia sp. (in: high G+C Gram-positive bacteria) TaxID=84139 RepID=UPI0039E67F96